MASDKEKEQIVVVKEVTDPCPDCGNELIHQEGIKVCRHCGWESAPC